MDTHQVPAMLRAFHSWRSEAAQAVANLQCYVSLEVLEPAWRAFVKALPQARDLDAVLELHEGMLAAITEVGGGAGPELVCVCVLWGGMGLAGIQLAPVARLGSGTTRTFRANPPPQPCFCTQTCRACFWTAASRSRQPVPVAKTSTPH